MGVNIPKRALASRVSSKLHGLPTDTCAKFYQANTSERELTVLSRKPKCLSFHTPDVDIFRSRIVNCVLGPIQPRVVVSTQGTSHLHEVISKAKTTCGVLGTHQGGKTPLILSITRRLPERCSSQLLALNEI